MPAVSFEEFEGSILATMAKIELFNFSPDYDYFWLLYEFGFRAEELRNLQTWSILPNGNILAPTLKNGTSRELDVSLVPLRVLLSIALGTNLIAIKSYSTYQRYIAKGSNLHLLTVGGKHIRLHAFRHYRMKKMFQDGQSLAQIQSWFGLAAIATVAGYVYSDVRRPD